MLDDKNMVQLEKTFYFLQNVDLKNKKVLRRVNKTLRFHVDNSEKNRFKDWKFRRAFSSTLLNQFSQDVKTIRGKFYYKKVFLSKELWYTTIVSVTHHLD